MLQKEPGNRPTAKYLKDAFDFLPYMAKFIKSN
jgi:hypothetical protein